MALKRRMKTILFLAFLIPITLGHSKAYSQTRISGKVQRENGSGLAGANVYLLGTIEGTSTTPDGTFSFLTNQRDTVSLVVHYMGYQEYRLSSLVTQLNDLTIILHKNTINLNDIEIVASRFKVGQSQRVKQMDPLDIVMTGSSNGDIYGALKSLPGSQIVGEDGRLYIRGGSSRESQTYIDGMHVLVPYSSTATNTPVRGRFSPFLFKGINFSLGGYDSEYGQALSSILPMETKDAAVEDKMGVNFSPINAGIGGTKATNKGSLSFNTDYMNMGFYNTLFPDHHAWEKPYQKVSSEFQYKVDAPRNNFKFYIGHDFTNFAIKQRDDFSKDLPRSLELKENSIFLSATYRGTIKGDYSLFIGGANSLLDNTVHNASVSRDRYKVSQNETHLKGFIQKTYSNLYKAKIGIEDFNRVYKSGYVDEGNNSIQNLDANYNLVGVFFENQFNVFRNFYTTFSSRYEYSDFNHTGLILPRLSLTYIWKSTQLSGVLGKYAQSPEDKFIASTGNRLKQETALHYILSSSIESNGRSVRIEAYYKKYDDLTRQNASTYNSTGFGDSKGIDFFIQDEKSIDKVRYSMAYSYNDSKRLSENYLELSQPQYASKHNVALNIRYSIPSIKTYIGVSNLFASGRPYTDPNRQGFHNAYTKAFNSFDMNATFLLNRNLILHTSIINLFDRNNIFNYKYPIQPNEDNIYVGKPVVASRNRFLFIGVFLTLKNSVAYDVSNF